MKSCFLHIGSGKTGTTNIQKFFGRKRDEILQDGFWFPRLGSNKAIQVHRKFSQAALQGLLNDDSELTAEFRNEHRSAEKAGAHTAIISCEFFHSKFRKPAPIAYLRTFLMPFFDNLRVIYYARRQDTLAVSMHSTAVHMDNATDRSALSVYRTKGHHYFDHLAVCDLWAEQFGRENMICKIYDRNKLRNGDIIDDIGHIVGLAKHYDRKRITANESFSTECMNALLLFNKSPYVGNRRLRREIIAIGRERGGAKVPTLTRSEAREFLSLFQEHNREFFAKYVDPSLGTDFEGTFDSYPDALSEPTADEILDFLFGPLPQGACDLEPSERRNLRKDPTPDLTRRTGWTKSKAPADADVEG